MKRTKKDYLSLQSEYPEIYEDIEDGWEKEKIKRQAKIRKQKTETMLHQRDMYDIAVDLRAVGVLED